LPKIQQAAAWRGRKRLNFHIEVDGGITFETAAECARCGADTFVSGTGLLKQPRLKSAISKMRQIAADAYVEGLNRP
jgi:ribulose-phosphate 3-epimerase